MKRAGFTMIELIFVIVILGILAAVAIPKLSATRDDAKIAKSLTDVTTAIQDMGAYYTAQGNFGTPRQMTNVVFTNRDSNLTVGPNYQVDGVDCIDFNTTAAALADGNITVGTTAGATGVCDKLQTILTNKGMIATHSFGGQKVDFGN